MKFKITSPYGELAEVRNNIPHHGIDLAMPEGTPLRSIGDGVVESVLDLGGENLGKGVIIKFEDGTTGIYGHMSDIDVKPREIIKEGDLLGLSGNTGLSTGPHLHFGLKDGAGNWSDPTPIVEKVDAMSGDASFGFGSWFLDKYNGFADRVIGGQVEFILKPIGNMLRDGLIEIGHILTEFMPEIGGFLTVICAVGIMFTGNAPKWLARWGVGMMGVIIWLTAK
ncbi:M23 family metallopeptidase [Cytobacillus firmus]|uniref:M23 family metallopeptidase n=1 Tax=Cytobacillus firmus TaxID=1399 RepID=UPI0036BD2450